MSWITLAEVLKLPYGTELERYESHCTYIMEQELKIINLDRESERDYPAITADILEAKFRIIKREKNTMSKYRKKPVVIEAFQWTGDINQTEDPSWIVEAIIRGEVWFNNAGAANVTMEIVTLEGNHIATRGDYIIQGVKGEIYPCKPDIFEMTYEQVAE